MPVKPLHDKVLIKRLEEENKTVSGIIIPDNSQEKPFKGEVIAVGSGYRAMDGTLTALEVKAGDKVLFEKRQYPDVKIKGEEFLMMQEANILGILS